MKNFKEGDIAKITTDQGRVRPVKITRVMDHGCLILMRGGAVSFFVSTDAIEPMIFSTRSSERRVRAQLGFTEPKQDDGAWFFESQ